MKKNKIKLNNLIATVNEMGEEVDLILEERKKEKYFNTVVLQYSLIEYLLKWSLFIWLLWEKSNKERNDYEINNLGNYCKNLNFFNALQVAYSIDMIDTKLYKRINNIRIERNDIIHEFWLYKYRNNNLIMRKKLEKITNITSELTEIITKIINKIGYDLVQEIIL